jgi:hypothetical protein
MQAGQFSRGRSFFLPATLFILAYFVLFSYDSLNTYLTFDDGMNLISMHHQGEAPLWRNMVEVLKVFTTANRPLGALFYRPMYNIFGFDPRAFRIAIYMLLLINIFLAHRFARTVGATTGAAALSTLLFCYNASLGDLFYNTGTVYDVLCFLLVFIAFLLYARERLRGSLSGRTMITVMVILLLALDAKEMAVMLVVDLVFFELLFRPEDLKNPELVPRVWGFIAAVGVVTAIFLKVKVTDMQNNALYAPHKSLPFVLHGMAHYFEQYFYLKPDSVSVGGCAAIIIGLLAISAMLRNRVALFGALFYVVGVFPVSIIPPRGGYAAYVAFPGLTLAIGAILDDLRTRLLAATGQQRWNRISMAVLFLFVAGFSIFRFAHQRREGMGAVLWSQQRVIGFVEAFKRQIPEFPPDARILITDDPWGPDWGPMFLVRLKYNNSTVWVDRAHNPEKTGERDSYDLIVTYKDPYIDFYDAKILGIKLKWEIRARSLVPAQLEFSAPTESRAPRNISFSPQAVRTGMPVTVTVPGVANMKIDAVYRVISWEGKSTPQVAAGWCTLDDKGTCTIMAPEVGRMGALAVDWIRRQNERWIFTNGILTVVE